MTAPRMITASSTGRLCSGTVFAFNAETVERICYAEDLPMGGLIDSFGRSISYLRLSVIDHCNYRCAYCMPNDAMGSRRADLLGAPDIVRLARLFTELGVSKIRLTGGEPLLRHDLPELAAQIRRLPGLADLSLSTNGPLLDRRAARLRQAGN